MLEVQENGTAEINVHPLTSPFARSVLKKLGLPIEEPEENLN